MKNCFLLCIFLLTCLVAAFYLSSPASGQAQGPLYFLAIHNEPFHRDGGEEKMRESYAILKRMVERADSCHIRLTLMFSPQWVDFLLAQPDRKEQLRKWKAEGHEIAAHHHSIYHGNWDGYTDYTKEEALRERERNVRMPEKYLGTLKDYIEKLKLINPGIKSGCLNDEYDKNCLPDAIIFDTGSGFANHGTPGTREGDGRPEKGRNDFITKGNVRGIERKWLCHFQTTTVGRQYQARSVFLSMKSGAYGSVNHSSPREEEAFNAWIDFLHSNDREGKRCRTLTEIMNAGALVEVSLSEAVLTEKGETRPRAGRASTALNRPCAGRAPSSMKVPAAELREAVEKLKRLIEERRAEGVDVSRATELDGKSLKAFREGNEEECLKLLRQAIDILGG